MSRNSKRNSIRSKVSSQFLRNRNSDNSEVEIEQHVLTVNKAKQRVSSYREGMRGLRALKPLSHEELNAVFMKYRLNYVL